MNLITAFRAPVPPESYIINPEYIDLGDSKILFEVVKLYKE